MIRFARAARGALFTLSLAGSAPLVTLPGLTPPAPQTRVNEDARLMSAFLERVKQYVELHRAADGTLPDAPKEATSQQVEEHTAALARLIGERRRRADQGEIFTRETRAFFRRQLARALAGPDGQQVRASIMEENPGPIRLRINGRYPDSVPVSTMPEPILAVLPVLPAELEYRFIGDRLVLLDVHADLVVDYIDDALPR